MIAAGTDGRVVFANDAARSRWPDAVSAEAHTLLPADACERFRAAATSALEAGVATQLEWGEHGPGGVRAWFLATISPLRDGGGVAHLGTRDWAESEPGQGTTFFFEL